MLNKERIRQMVILASYEAGEGTKDIEISAYFKKDYISFHVLYTLLWVTLGYALFAVMILLAQMEKLLEDLTISLVIDIVKNTLVGYGVVLLVYGIFSYFFYKKKHHQARERVKEYNHELIVLNKMYKKEND